jgi:hypothetical protein
MESFRKKICKSVLVLGEIALAKGLVDDNSPRYRGRRYFWSLFGNFPLNDEEFSLRTGFQNGGESKNKNPMLNSDEQAL